MKRVIWKYSWDPVMTEMNFDMPVNAKILHVDVQRGIPCIWAMVDPTVSSENRQFLLWGTGASLPGNETIHLEHLGSFLMQEGRFVFHIFEVFEVSDG